MHEALAIRTRVFVEEQGVPPDEEIDEHDRSDTAAIHALARTAGRAVGAGRAFTASPDTARIGRMAVLPEARGCGAGRAILDALLEEIRKRGFRYAELHAQSHACGFYEKAGFREHGALLLDAGILHRPMRRNVG